MIRIDADDFADAMRHVGRAFGKHADGKRMKRETAKQLRKIMQPLVARRKAAVMALPSKGHSGASMRQAVARQIRASTRWRGRNAGLSIIQRARGMPREFNMAGRMFNREEGWNPTTLAGEQVHQQVTPAEWFDSAANDDRALVHKAVVTALGDVSDQLADELRRIR